MTKFLLLISISVLFISCQNSPLRAPNFVKTDFDSNKVTLLKWAARNRILFQMPDSVFTDVKSSSVGSSCKKIGEPAWSEVVYKSLSTLKQNPALHDKIHIVEIKQAQEPSVSTSQDLDGLTYLIIAYARHEKKTPLAKLEQAPCTDKSETLMNQEKVDIQFSYPESQEIVAKVKSLTKRETPDRWKFNTQFLVHLADYLTIFKLNPELTFERSAEGTSFLASFLNEQSNLIAKQNFGTLNFWLNELSVRSHAAGYLKIFNLTKAKELTYGMGFQQDSFGLSFPYLTYKVQDGRYSYPTLTQLDKCLHDLSARYKRSLASISSDISLNSESFLAPGYTCH